MADHADSIRFDGDPIIEGKAVVFTAPRTYRANDGVLESYPVGSAIRALDEGDVLLSSNTFRGLNLAADAQAQIVEIPELGYGREESANNVWFGQLVVSSAAEREAGELVAIKPRYNPGDAVHEFATMQQLNGMRSPSRHPLTFEPIGFCALPDNMVGVVSRYEHSVQTYDNLFWRGTDEERTPERIRQALSRAGFALGAMHALGFSHGDAQIKNLGRANDGIRIVDLEDATAFSANPDRAEQVVSATIQDVQVLVNSLYPRDEEPDGRYDAHILHDFLPNYLRTTHLPTSRVPEQAQLTIDEISPVIGL